jgi:hypothetical protein
MKTGLPGWVGAQEKFFQKGGDCDLQLRETPSGKSSTP